MLKKISEFSTKLDKKRVYTAVGALVVALAAGHVMQRTTAKGPDLPPQQAAATAASSVPAPMVASLTGDAAAPELAAKGLSSGESAAAPEEPALAVALADSGVAPQNPAAITTLTEAPTEAPFVEQDLAAPTTDIAAEVTPEAEVTLAAADAVTDPMALDLDLDFETKEPEATVEAPLDTIEVTRADKMDALSGVPEDVIDLDPPAALPVSEAVTTDDCAVQLTHDAAPGALVTLGFTAPCDPGATVEFVHAGLRFTEVLDDMGAVTISVPAFASPAVIEATFKGESHTTTTTSLPDLAQYDRVALVWQGGTGLQLHALENGAGYGDAGHVWAEAPKSPEVAVNGEGGFLTLLGSASGGYAADVYTYPVSLMAAPAISIETQVSEDTCGTKISGHYLRSGAADGLTDVEVGMAVPDCDAIGEYLVLKNLPQELTIARN
ncbi:hypothetical protein [uncultured Maritimibacter sp.]|jgi:hypothetical protein|uniref:hypothetical protein n=1 Tax=uncultured Maritimibacter sp. TaxID=991866 RepID=UPI00262CF109|nr:hypothetical protein [uncultured Maritimibacter sp.]